MTQKLSFPRHPIASPASPLQRLELTGRAAQSLLAITAVVTAAAILLGYVLICRYLAAFGQPGLVSSSDSGGMLVGAAAVFLVVALTLTGAVGTPIFVRLMSHEWASAGGTFRPLAGLLRYGFLHGTAWIGLFICSIHVWLGFVAAAAFFIIYLVCMRCGGFSKWITAAGTFLLANVGLIIWVAILGATYDSYLQRFIETESVARLILFFGPFVVIHASLSLLPLRVAVCLAVLLALGIVIERGDRAVTALALRWLNLGGGTPMTYVRRTADGVPIFTSTACLVLNVKERRVVWLPPEPEGGVAGALYGGMVSCNLPDFIERTRSGGTQADRGKAADDLVAMLKPEDFGAAS